MSTRKLAVLTTLLLVCGTALGQKPGPDFGPPPSGPPVPVMSGAQPAGPDALPPPAQPIVPPPRGPFGSGFVQQPLPAPLPLPPMDWVVDPPPGLFVGLEADVVRPSLRVNGVDGRADLDWTIAPRAEVGYRFEHAGSLVLSYRYLQSDAAQDDSDQGGPATDFRLQEHWLDLAYRTRPFGPGPDLFLQAEVGLRTAYLHATGGVDTPTESDRGRESFWGIGPEAGLRLTWALGDSGVALFGDTSLGVLFGRTWDHEDDTVFDPVNGPTTTTTSWGEAQPVVDWRGEVGLSWTLPHRPWFRFDVGVRGEVFGWDHVTYSDVGPFLRCFVAF